MSRNLRAVLIVLFLAALAVPVSAQKTELAIGVGGYFPINLTGVGNAVAIEGTVARRIASVPLISAYIEVPVVGSLNSTVTSVGLTSSTSYSALFIAPGIKIKLAPGFFVSPWFAAGGGLAHFSPSSGLKAAGGQSKNTGVFDVGGGLDIKVAPYVSLRGEVRDFYSGGIGFTSLVGFSPLTGFNEKQHNIVTTAGLVLRF